MAGAESESLSDVVLLFGNITGTEGVEKLSENTRYLFIPPSSNEGDHHESPRWKRHLIDELDGPIFAFRFGKDMESPLGWNLGSSEDLDQCDFQIVSREAKYTSKKHIRINIAPDTFCPRLTNLSRNPVRIYVGGRPIALEQGQQPIEILRSVEVKVGDVSLCMWRATLTTKEESVFRRNAEQFSREYLDAMPVPCAYAVKSGASTYNLRFGVDGTEYRQENAQPVSAGAFASVLKVRNMRTGTIYAAKMPHFRTTDMASTAQKRLESLRTEYDKIVRLDHPYIVTAVDFVVGANWSHPPWLIMEWMECDLSSFHLQRRDRAKFVTHLSEGLQYMHAKCFTHRDLKPQNILIEHNQERLVVVKIADFGTTKHDLFGKMESYAGTNIYMAPEFWESELNYTNAVDMWSLGIVLFEQFIPDAAWSVIWKTSMPPSQEWHEQWRQNELDSRMDDIPPEWRSLVSGLLTLAPEKRWTASRSVEWVRAEEDHLGDDQASAQSTPLASECEGLAEDLDNVDTASAERQVAGTSSPVDTEYDSEIERRYPALQSNIKSQDYS